MNISLLNRTETHQNLRIYNYHTFNYNPNYFIWKAILGMCLWKVYIILSPLKFAFSCLHAFYTPGKFSLHKTKFFNTRSLTALLLTLWVCWGPSFRFYIQFGYKPHLKDEFFFFGPLWQLRVEYFWAKCEGCFFKFLWDFLFCFQKL